MDEKYIEYCRQLIAGICDKPEDVSVEKTTDERGVLLKVKIDKNDMGMVIGKGGKTIMAIRYLVSLTGIKDNARVSIKLEEPEGSTAGEGRSQW
jgi:hypothetical protein